MAMVIGNAGGRKCRPAARTRRWQKTRSAPQRACAPAGLPRAGAAPAVAFSSPCKVRVHATRHSALLMCVARSQKFMQSCSVAPPPGVLGALALDVAVPPGDSARLLAVCPPLDSCVCSCGDSGASGANSPAAAAVAGPGACCGGGSRGGRRRPGRRRRWRNCRPRHGAAAHACQPAPRHPRPAPPKRCPGPGCRGRGAAVGGCCCRELRRPRQICHYKHKPAAHRLAHAIRPAVTHPGQNPVARTAFAARVSARSRLRSVICRTDQPADALRREGPRPIVGQAKRGQPRVRR